MTCVLLLTDSPAVDADMFTVTAVLKQGSEEAVGTSFATERLTELCYGWACSWRIVRELS
jgi:hypothetical protein